jgi:hypothetical protein
MGMVPVSGKIREIMGALQANHSVILSGSLRFPGEIHE